MSIESAMRRHYLNDSTLTALIGTRFFPDERPQTGDMAALPAITYLRTSTRREKVMGAWIDLGWPMIQYDIWASTRGSADSVSEAFRKRTMQATDTVGDAFAEAERVNVEIETDFKGHETDTGLYRHTYMLRISHEEEGP